MKKLNNEDMFRNEREMRAKARQEQEEKGYTGESEVLEALKESFPDAPALEKLARVFSRQLNDAAVYGM